jgi:signal transduction histidine kinase/DNA-binding CsgD family transcriptional regulator
VLSLLATGVVAVAFAPLRDWLQRSVNRLIYGERDEPYRVLSRLGRHVEATLTPDSMLSAIVETVAQALRLPYVAITLRQDDRFVTAAEYGTGQHDLVELPLVYGSETVGQLRLAPRARGESFNPADWRLLEDLARQMGVAAHAVRLAVDLHRSNEHLRAAREGLVTAREEERRRLRRDLHDGLGPALASESLKVGAIRKLMTRDQSAADALLSELGDDIEATIADIRRLVYDLRPPALDELGLVGAIRERVAQLHAELHVVVEAPERRPTLPAAVEVAAYRITQEALTNVARHARAKLCLIRLGVDEGVLCLEVLDDGVGLAGDRKMGVGMFSMRERAEELGGTLAAETLPSGGTRILAQLPIVRSSPNTRILVVTMFEDDHSVFSAIRAGARGYVLKGAKPEEVLRAIRVVAGGDAIFSPSVANRLIDFFGGLRAEVVPQSFPELTDREREILDFIAQGRSNPDIARQLSLSVKTVANHVSNILSKLQLADRAQAMLRAREAGLGQGRP